MSSINSNLAVDQDVQLTNDKKIMTHYSDPKRAQAGKTVNQGRQPFIYFHIINVPHHLLRICVRPSVPDFLPSFFAIYRNASFPKLCI